MSESETAKAAQAMELRAAEAFNQRRYDLAAGLYRRLSESQPLEPAPRLKLAASLQRLGCRLMAAEAFGMGAELLQASGQLPAAVTACRAGLALQPSNPRLVSLLETIIHQLTDAQEAEAVVPGTPTLRATAQPPPAIGDAAG